MSTHHYLYCKNSGECVEAVARVGDKSVPRICANAMGAFLLYHQDAFPGAELRLINIDDLPDGRNLFESIADMEEEKRSIGSFHGYQPPILIWSESNYHELLRRRPKLLASLQEMESQAGTWHLQSKVE